MKNYKYIGLLLLSIGVASCDVNNELDIIEAEVIPEVALNTGDLDFSNYVAVGASLTAGFTDGALFAASQQNSFPNILATKFSTEFTQPLMKDNIGGFLFGGQPNSGFAPRLYFYSDPVPACPNYTGPTPLGVNRNTGDNTPEVPTTEAFEVLSGSFNNFGIPGAKSFHFLGPGYGNPAGLVSSPASANPYFVRMASSTSVRPIDDIKAKNATFFTLSEIGANDVLGNALSGGESNVTSDGYNPITPLATFNFAFNTLLEAMTSRGAKGVVGNVPDVTTLAHFTTVPYNPLDPNSECTTFGAQVANLNAQLIGPVSQILTALGAEDRLSLLSDSENSPLLITDEDLTNFSAQISGALQQGGVTAAQADLMGSLYGQARHATANDLFVLPVSSIIGTSTGVPATVPAPFNSVGVTFPLADKWVLTPEEQLAIKIATGEYNDIIEAVVNSNPNLALVDLEGILQEATTGIKFDNYTLTASLVTGGLVSLDGFHLTARGYALMANKILAAMDVKFGSNFTTATNGLAKAGDYPTNYSAMLK
jgi:hypothetical protein